MIELLGGDIALVTRWEEALKGYDPLVVDAVSPSETEKIVIADFASRAREVLRYLKSGKGGGIRLIVLEGVPSEETAARLLEAGVRGYGNAYMQPVHLQSCVETVKGGNIWVYPEFVYAMVRKLTSQESGKRETYRLPERLTPREKELAGKILEGLSNREIAEALGISERTVKAHLGSIYAKLHVTNRLELAMKLGRDRTFVQ
jgi:DNA-binding NarL/FixJ family response regulator